MRTLRRLLAAALFVSALVFGWRFASANPEPVAVSLPLVGAIATHPLWLVLVGAFAVGFAVAAVVGLYQAARLSLLARRWRRVASGLEAELHQLRNLPLAGSETSRGGSAPSELAPSGADRSGSTRRGSTPEAPERSARAG
jgi:hypothetical protein